VTIQNEINVIIVKELFIFLSHSFARAIMFGVATIPRIMPKEKEYGKRTEQEQNRKM
jgi:hypothetical protein